MRTTSQLEKEGGAQLNIRSEDDDSSLQGDAIYTRGEISEHEHMEKSERRHLTSKLSLKLICKTLKFLMRTA